MQLGLRLPLVLIFLSASCTKLRESYLIFAMSIDSYQILPPNGLLAVARSIPWIELAIGLSLLAGWRIAPAATAATVLLGAFSSVMLFTRGLGMTIDCGCFGLGEAVIRKTLVRDGALGCSAR